MSDCGGLNNEKHGSEDQVCTSVVNCYDGGNFGCFDFGANPTLNSVLKVIGAKACEEPEAVSEDCNCTLKTLPLGSSWNIYNGFSCLDTTYVENSTAETLIIDIANNLCDLYTTVGSLPTSVPEFISDLDVGDPLFTNINALSCFSGYAADTGADALILDMATKICTNLRCCDELKDIIGILWQEVYSGDITGDPTHDGDVVLDHGGTGTSTPTGLSVDLANPTNADENTYMVAGTLVKVVDSTVVLTATRDNYVDVGADGTYYVTAVAIGNPAPPELGLRLYKYETDASSVVSTTDLRNYFFHNGASFADNSIGTRHVKDLNITKAKLADNITAGVLAAAAFLRITSDAKGMITGTTGNMNISTLTDGDILRYVASSGRWENFAFGASTLPAAVARQMTYYDGANWRASSLIQMNSGFVRYGSDVTEPPGSQFIHKWDTSMGFHIKPPVPNLSVSAGGTLAPSTTYYYKIEWYGGHTEGFQPIEYSATTTVSDLTIILDLFWPKGAISGKLYRSTTSGSYTQYHAITPASGEQIRDDGTLAYVAGTPVTLKYGAYSFQYSHEGIFSGAAVSDQYLMRMVNYKSSVADAWSVENRPHNPTSEITGVRAIAQYTGAQRVIGAVFGATNSTIDNIGVHVDNGRLLVSNTHTDLVHAGIELKSTTSGIKFPEMTTAERDAMTMSASYAGLVVYNTDNLRLEFYNGSAWLGFSTQVMSWVAVRVSAARTVNNGEHLVTDASGGALIHGLPPVADSKDMTCLFTKEDASGNTVTIDGNGGETIDGNLTIVLAAQWDKAMLHCDGTQWLRLI